MIYRSFSKRQLLAMTWWNRPGLRAYDAILCDGAVRSGKTIAMTVGFFLWSMTQFRGELFALCGKTVGALRRNLVMHLEQWLDGLFTVTEHRSDNCLEVTDRTGRINTYYLFGGQDERSYTHIQGMTLAGVLLDEVALMPRSFVEQAVARCSVPGSRFWFNCNPASPEHWFYQTWILQAHRKNALHLHFTMADNPALEQTVRQRYERMYSGVFFRRYVLGQWCAAEGRIYDFDPAVHVTREIPQTGRYFISVDYGTHNPFSAGLWCLSGGRAVRLREYYHSGRDSGVQRTDGEYVQALETLAGEYPVEQVIVDPSAASLIAQLRKRGKFPVRKAKNAVLPGIRLVTELLRAGRLLVTPACKDAIREFALYCWEQDSAWDCPRKRDDHAMDEIRYFCSTVMRREVEPEYEKGGK